MLLSNFMQFITTKSGLDCIELVIFDIIILFDLYCSTVKQW